LTCSVFPRYLTSLPSPLQYFKPDIHTTNQWEYLSDWYLNRTVHFLDLFQATSEQVDLTPTQSAALTTLRNEPSLEMRFMNTEKTGTYTELLSLRVAASMMSAYARHSLFMNYASDAEDASFYAVVANWVKTLPDAMALNTLYIRQELADNHATLMLTYGLLLAASVAVVVFVSLVFVRPIVVRIEESKTQVLVIFQDIPYSLRRSLRRKAYGVFKLVQRGSADEKLQRSMGDDDDAQLVSAGGGPSAGSGAASAAGSECTLGTRLTTTSAGLSAADAAGDAYAEVFRQFQEAKQGAATATTPLTAGLRGGALGPHERVRTRSSRAGLAIDTARGDGSSLVGAEASALELGQSSFRTLANASASAPAGSTAASRAAKRYQASSAASAAGSVAAKSTADSGVSLSEEDLRLAARGSKATAAAAATVMGRRALREVVLKYALFLLLVAGFYGVILWQTSEKAHTAEVRSLIVEVAHDRVSAFQLAMFQSTQHLFYDFDVLVQDPINANVLDGRFSTAGMRRLANAMDAHNAIVYGDADMGVPRIALDDEQQHLIFEDACDMTEQRAEELYPNFSFFTWFYPKCSVFEGGALSRGLVQLMLLEEDLLSTCLAEENSQLLAWKVQSLPPPPGTEAQSERVYQIVRRANTVVSEFIAPGLYLSGGIYRDTAISDVAALLPLVLGLTAGLILYLVLAYAAIFYPLTDSLFRANAQTKAVMLLAPADLLRHVEAAQRYIVRNLNSD
jgi:hypothetical protein